MYLLIIFLPLLGTFFAGMYGSKVGAFGAMRLTTFCMIATCLLSSFAFFEVALSGSPCFIECFRWFDTELVSFS